MSELSAERCETCRFYLGEYSSSRVYAVGRCRRYPHVACWACERNTDARIREAIKPALLEWLTDESTQFRRLAK
jgi:hypothetical protein